MSIDALNSAPIYCESSINQNSTFPSSSHEANTVTRCWNQVNKSLASYFSTPITASIADTSETREIDLSKGDFIDDRCWQLVHAVNEPELILLSYILENSTIDNYSELFTLSYVSSPYSIQEMLETLKQQNQEVDPFYHEDYVIHEQTSSSCLFEVWSYAIPSEQDTDLSEHDKLWLKCHSIYKLIQENGRVIQIAYNTCNTEEPLIPKWVPILNNFKAAL